MGVGNTLKILFTQKVKCENCGMVIVDGTERTSRMFLGNDGYHRATNPQGVGIFNTLYYGSKGRILCDVCKSIEKATKQYEKEIAKEEAVIAEAAALEEENLRLQNQLLRKQLENEANAERLMTNNSRPNQQTIAPAAKRAANFCAGCGSALKPNARFCGKCGRQIG
jgi:hypothetical protein